MFSVHNLPAIIAASIIKTSAMAMQTLVYTSSADFTGNVASFTTASLAIGAATPSRWIVVGIYTNFNTARSLLSVTIGGISATLIRGFPHLSSGGSRFEFWKANVPIGTTATVAVSATGGLLMYDGTLGLWAASSEPFFYSMAFDNVLSGATFSTTIDVPNGGALIAMSSNDGGSSSVASTTGVTLDYISTLYDMAAASEDLLSTQTGRTVSITHNTPGTVPAYYGFGVLSLSFNNAPLLVFQYTSTGADQTYTVPADITMLYAGLAGAGAGSGSYSASSFSGAGGYTYIEIPVTAGDVLLIQVGQGGQEGLPGGVNKGGDGGWPDGGSGTFGDAPGGGGGGSSRIWLNGVLIAVAGAGGGDAGYAGNGGAGGGLVGQSCSNSFGGTGGTQSAGGFDNNAPGTIVKQGLQITSSTPARTGGWGGISASTTAFVADDGGAGGGGYWGGGGGGGDGLGGGGGSGYIHPSYTGTTFVGAGRVPPSKLTLNPFYDPTIAIGNQSGTNRKRGGHGLILLSRNPTIFV